MSAVHNRCKLIKQNKLVFKKLLRIRGKGEEGEREREREREREGEGERELEKEVRGGDGIRRTTPP